MPVLYCYCGESRRCDVSFFLREISAKNNCTVPCTEIDLCRGGEAHNLADKIFLDTLIARITNLEFNFVICTPPCNTHSRATYANKFGPAPLRSEDFPLGLPHLKGKLAEKVEVANSLIHGAILICLTAHTAKVPFMLEHPEDLGATQNGIPASIWNLPSLRELAAVSGANTFAFFQCRACMPNSSAATPDYPKPTRFITTAFFPGSFIYHGWPVKDDLGWYSGPLPRWCGHRHYTKLTVNKRPSGDEKFKSAAAAAYPPAMCEWIAGAVFAAAKNCIQSRVTSPAVGQGQEKSKLSSRDSLDMADWETSSEDEDGDRKPVLGEGHELCAIPRSYKYQSRIEVRPYRIGFYLARL